MKYLGGDTMKKKYLLILAVAVIFMQTLTMPAFSDNDTETASENITETVTKQPTRKPTEKPTQKPTEKPTEIPTVDNSAEIAEKEKELDNLRKKIAKVNTQIENTKFEIAQLKQEMTDAKTTISSLDTTIKNNKEKVKKRLRAIYMTGGVSRIEVILGAKNFDDLINNIEYASMVARHDNQIIQSLSQDVNITKKAQKNFNKSKTELETKATQLESKRYELLGIISENEDKLQLLYAENGTVKKTDDNTDSIENRIQDYYQKQKATENPTQKSTQKPTQKSTQKSTQNSTKKNTPTESTYSSDDDNDYDDFVPQEKGTIISTDIEKSSSGYVWPVTGFYYLTSMWNENRGSYNHGAIDIADAGIDGASVLAAHSGTVMYAEEECEHNWGKSISCGCGGGYGNYVMLDHGDGHMTVYAHMSSVLVSTGESVSAGQVIGFVGSTGDSTGSHLHFETRYNGEKYNPLTEYPDISVSY